MEIVEWSARRCSCVNHVCFFQVVGSGGTCTSSCGVESHLAERRPRHDSSGVARIGRLFAVRRGLGGGGPSGGGRLSHGLARHRILALRAAAAVAAHAERRRQPVAHGARARPHDG
eukprot:2149536-Prymnesium_polylepis.1